MAAIPLIQGTRLKKHIVVTLLKVLIQKRYKKIIHTKSKLVQVLIEGPKSEDKKEFRQQR